MDDNKETPMWTDNVEEIGRLADTADNYIAATSLPLPASFHVEQLKAGLKDISARLKQIYVNVTGENPWEEK